MKWYSNTGIPVDKSWGTYYDQSYAGTGNYFLAGQGDNFLEGGIAIDSWKNGNFSHKANEMPCIYLGTGLNNNGIKNNIADLGGNMWEWSPELYLDEPTCRGGAADNIQNPVAVRSLGRSRVC